MPQREQVDFYTVAVLWHARGISCKNKAVRLRTTHDIYRNIYTTLYVVISPLLWTARSYPFWSDDFFEILIHFQVCECSSVAPCLVPD